jgi:hypothetical protein
VGYDDVHTATNVPSFTITSPGSGTAVSANSPVSVSVASTGLFPLVKMEVFLNNTYVGAASGATPILNFEPSQISNMHLGSNTLLITGTDSIGASANMSEEIIIQ